nr:MAG TPA: hypothetical protein [Bacteriophage sp.]
MFIREVTWFLFSIIYNKCKSKRINLRRLKSSQCQNLKGGHYYDKIIQ